MRRRAQARRMRGLGVRAARGEGAASTAVGWARLAGSGAGRSGRATWTRCLHVSFPAGEDVMRGARGAREARGRGGAQGWGEQEGRVRVGQDGVEDTEEIRGGRRGKERGRTSRPPRPRAVPGVPGGRGGGARVQFEDQQRWQGQA
ncbi:hypothetical protein AcV7_003297 [Taiwanofungus camphoratus]|nr:hypothetical protein AcV7_003297 [Antrodia cinnamomea]